MSTDDQDEGFKNIICRMLQEADNEDSENPRKEEDSGNSVNENEKSTEKIDIDSGITSEQNEKDNCDKNIQKENKKTENVGEIENCQKPHKESVELNEQSHVGSEIEDSKLHVDSKEVNPQNMDTKDNIENISTNTSDRAIDKETVLNTDKIKQEKNIYSNEDNETESYKISEKISKKNENTTDEMTVKEEVKCLDTIIQKEMCADDDRKDVNEKHKSLETMFLKDRIDSLINSCLSSKPSEVDLEVKKCLIACNVKANAENNCSTLPNVKQERENDKNIQKQQHGHLEHLFNSDEGKKMSENSGSSTSVSQMQNIQSPLKLTGNQNENNMKVAENLHEASKQKEGNLTPRKTTTFQTLIEKVLDNSLSKTKKCDSSQSANGFRQIVDHRITSKNQLHTIKNEIRSELLGKETSSTDRLRPTESKSDDMSLNKSKVVYLKDHIEKVLEKTFQNSSRKDSEDIREQERIATKYDERYQQNREPDQRILQRERSHSLVNDSIRHPVRDRSQSFSMIGTCPEVRRHKSLDNYDLEHLGPPKLIKVTEIYPDVNRDQGRYLQPPRIDTYDGNSRGSFRGSMSPGGSYSRSPLDQSPVSPYYNHSPNSWHGHSPREQHPPVPSNLSPNHTVPSPIYPSTRYPVSPGNSYPPNVGLTRYNSTSHVTHPTTQISSGSLVFQPPYPQTSPLPGYPVTALEGIIRPGYTIGNQQISPNSQHPSRHYPQQHLPARHPITSTQAFHSNELVNHSKYQMSPVHNYQQVSPRQPPYPTNHPQISPTSRSHVPYPIQTTQPIQRPMMQPQQQYPAGIDNNQNYPPAANMHHVRQSHVNPAFPSHGVNGRNNSAGYIDHNAPHRNAQTNHQVTGHVTGNVAQRISVPLPRSPQYMESNGRNPSVSSAMALGPVPPQHYFKQHQSQKPPQLFPSSPPIPSVREYSGISNRTTIQNQPHGGSSRPDVKYKQHEMMDIPPRIPSNSGDHIVIERPSNVAHQQTPVLDLSVKRDGSTVADSDPDMQPLDLTCKPKSQSSDPPQKRSLSKGYSGFEYLVKGPIEKRIFEENLGSSLYAPNTPKQSSLHDKSQYSSQGPYSSFEPQNIPGISIRQSSETAASNHGYSQNIQSQQQHQQQAVSAPSAHHGYKQNPPMGLQIPTSNQSASIIEGNITPTESGVQGQGQSSLNQSSQLQQDPKKVPNVSRHEPIQNILGSHSPNDILYLICRLCGQTYGSPYGFRKHFRNQHGFEPRAEHTIVQTISETKTAMQSPPTNCQALVIAQQPNPISVSEMDESQIRIAQNQSTTTVTNSNNRVLPNSSSHLEENVSGQSQNAIKSPAVLIKEESIGSLSSENSEEFRQKGNVDDSNNTGNRKCLECHECGQTFQLNDFGAYKRHCRQHGHPKINNPFDPNYSADLNRNVNSGDGFKSFKDTSAVDMSASCKKCDIPFTSESALKEHMKTTHPELLNFTCETCKEKFLDEISYQNHIKNVHFQTTELNENTVNVKKRIIGDFQKSQVDSKQEEVISSTSVLKSAADSMVTTASPDSSSDMIKKSSGVVDSQLGPQTPTINPPSDKQSGESDSNLDEKMEFSCQNSCDSATQKMEDSGNTDGLYLHKKFGSKRKYLSSYNSDIIESKILKKDITSPGNTRSPSVISTNSCDSELSNIPDGKMDVSDSNLSQSNINIDGFDESKSMVVDNVKCSTANKTEARHQLPFVWDRVTRSQVGRKPQKNN